MVILLPDNPMALEARARAFYHVKDFTACIKDCDRSIKLDPAYAVCWAMRGEAKVALGDKAGAISDLDEAVRIEPNQPLWVKLLSDTLGDS